MLDERFPRRLYAPWPGLLKTVCRSGVIARFQLQQISIRAFYYSGLSPAANLIATSPDQSLYALTALTSNNLPSTNGLTIANSPSSPRTSSRFDALTTNAARDAFADSFSVGLTRAARKLAPS